MRSNYLSLNVHKENKSHFSERYLHLHVLLNSVRQGWTSEVFENLVSPNIRAYFVNTHGNNRLCKNSRSVLKGISICLLFPVPSPTVTIHHLHANISLFTSHPHQRKTVILSTLFQTGNSNTVPIHLTLFLFEYSNSVPMFTVSVPGFAC